MSLTHIPSITTVLLFCICPLSAQDAKSSTAELHTNEDFINGLRHNVALTEVIDVFRLVFSKLQDEIVIYPTENYYYFRLTVNGKRIDGNLSLFADTRDRGILGFGYEEFSTLSAEACPGCSRVDVDAEIDRVLAWADLSVKDGVELKKIHPFLYTITFEGKTVTARLYDVGINPPQKAKLLDCEVYVGPSFDESGLQFHLIFNQAGRNLYWILNEDGQVPERFASFFGGVLLVGKRTEFAFYNDVANNRKLLVGVKAENVSTNNWYDGPFDQLPDNYVYTGQINLGKYIELCFPDTRGKINKYGHYLEESESRVALSSYLLYWDRTELLKLINRYKSASPSMAIFYSDITRPRYSKVKGGEITGY